MTPVVVDTPSSGEPAVRVLNPAPVPAPRSSDEWMDPAYWTPTPTPAPGRGKGGRHVKPDQSRSDRRWVDHLLTALALVGVVTTLVTVLAARSGLQPLVVRSGSMEPSIRTGAMVLVRSVPASSLQVGDVVAVERPDHTRVTHRIVSVKQQGRTAALTLKGDANEDPDPSPVVVDHAGRLVMSVSWLGRVGGFVASAKGGFVLGWCVAMVTLAVLRRRPE
jgi:signal peptidase I